MAFFNIPLSGVDNGRHCSQLFMVPAPVLAWHFDIIGSACKVIKYVFIMGSGES
jgi:hypothetical protein